MLLGAAAGTILGGVAGLVPPLANAEFTLLPDLSLLGPVIPAVCLGIAGGYLGAYLGHKNIAIEHHVRIK
jgi:hypothetical protein